MELLIPLELARERTPELMEVPVEPMSIILPVAIDPLISDAAFVAMKVPPEIASPPAESSTPVAPAEIGPELDWANVPVLSVKVPGNEISAPVPLDTVPSLVFVLPTVPVLRVMLPLVSAIDAPSPEDEMVLLLLLFRLDPVMPLPRLTLPVNVMSAPVPPVTASVFKFSIVPSVPVIPGLVNETPVAEVMTARFSLIKVAPLVTLVDVVTSIDAPTPLLEIVPVFWFVNTAEDPVTVRVSPTVNLLPIFPDPEKDWLLKVSNAAIELVTDPVIVKRSPSVPLFKDLNVPAPVKVTLEVPVPMQ
jgi:hypothetical protein